MPKLNGFKGRSEMTQCPHDLSRDSKGFELSGLEE